MLTETDLKRFNKCTDKCERAGIVFGSLLGKMAHKAWRTVGFLLAIAVLGSVGFLFGLRVGAARKS